MTDEERQKTARALLDDPGLLERTIESLIAQGLVERLPDGRTRVTGKRPPWEPPLH